MLCPCSSTQQEVMPLVPRPRSLPCLPPSTSTNSVSPGTLTLTINPMDIIQSDTGHGGFFSKASFRRQFI